MSGIINVNLTAEDIDKLVVETILKSGFGKTVEEGVRKCLNAYDSPVENAVKALVTNVCREMVRGQFEDKIRVSVAKYIEENIKDHHIDAIISKATSKILEAVERY